MLSVNGYIGKDIDDANRLGVFNKELLPENVKKYLGTENTQIMNSIIIDVIKNSYNKPYISMSKEVYDAVVELKKFNYDNIYERAITPKDSQRYTSTIETLYGIYSSALELNDYDNDIYKVFLHSMSDEYKKNTTDSQKIIDYISGMTDNFLQRQYEKYK